MTLVDTSVWVDHFQKKGGNRALVSLLEDDQVLSHEFVLGELYLGGAANTGAWKDLLALPRAATASFADALRVADKSAQFGTGWVDVHLMAAALLVGASILTLDTKLARAFRATL